MMKISNKKLKELKKSVESGKLDSDDLQTVLELIDLYKDHVKAFKIAMSAIASGMNHIIEYQTKIDVLEKKLQLLNRNNKSGRKK